MIVRFLAEMALVEVKLPALVIVKSLRVVQLAVVATWAVVLIIRSPKLPLTAPKDRMVSNPDPTISLLPCS